LAQKSRKSTKKLVFLPLVFSIRGWAMMNNIKWMIRDLHWSQWLGIFGLGLLFIALRWNNFNAPLIRDEGEYAYAAQLLIQGLAPYQYAFIQKPPGVIYSYTLANLLFPEHFWSPRVLAAVFVALATVLLGLIARWEFGRGFALLAMWLMTPMVLLPEIDQFTANTEMFLLLPLLATVAVYCYSRGNGHKNSHWFLAGFLAAATLLYKYTALPILGLVFVSWLIETWSLTRRMAVMGRRVFSAVAGGTLAVFLGLGFFFIHDGGKSFWECTVVFNRYYAGSSGFALNYFWSKCEMFWANWWILFLIPWAVLLKPQPRFLFWLGLYISALFASGASCYPQYYILMMPFWALLSAAGLTILSLKISHWAGKLGPWAAHVMVAGVLILVIRPDLPWMLCRSEKFIEAKMGAYPFVEAQELADQVSQMSSPSDFVFIAGSEPEILCYAHRFSPTRFITSYALMIPTPVAAGYQREAINALQKNPPKLIVFVAASSSWLRQPDSPPAFYNFLNEFIGQNYLRLGGYLKNSAQKSDWTNQPSADQFGNATLLLYGRKQ
jgi:hypothetical protein